MNNSNVTVCSFNRVNLPSDFKEVSFDQVLSNIEHSETLKEQIEILRQADVDLYNKHKMGLPAFSVSTTFNSKRANNDVKEYNGIIHLDYDHIEDPKGLKEKLSKISFVLAAFISPSGQGLKVFVKTKSSKETHTKYFYAIKSLCDTVAGIDSDEAVKDIARLCFYSSDSEIYINKNSTVFNIESLESPAVEIKNPSFEWLFNYTSNKQPFISGNRNVFAFLFGCNANRFGMNKEGAINYLIGYEEPGFDKQEITRTVEGAYIRYPEQFANLQYCKTSTLTDENTNQSEMVSDDIYKELPPLLKEACMQFEGRERDVFFVSALTVLSGYFSNVKGVYDNKIVYPNIYMFVVANAASGKSAAKYAKAFGVSHHKKLVKMTDEAINSYKIARDKYEKALKSKKADDLTEPLKPKQKIFFFPGNSSEASLVGLIADNEGQGCIFETEADSVSGSNKQEWGGFSHVLRNNLHHESISRSRKTDNEFIEIENPRFSFLTTGTPDQVQRLIPSAEDGLYSRFLFYSYVIPYSWRSTYTAEIKDSTDSLIAAIGDDFYSKSNPKTERTFNITKEQGSRLDNAFKPILKQLELEKNDNAVSVLFRHGLMVYKIAMILSTLDTEDKAIICSEKYFNISLDLVLNIFYKNSYNMLNRISGREYMDNKHNLVYEFLPKKFSRKTAIDIAKKVGVKERSADTYLSKMLTAGRIIKSEHGVYEKSS